MREVNRSTFVGPFSRRAWALAGLGLCLAGFLTWLGAAGPARAADEAAKIANRTNTPAGNSAPAEHPLTPFLKEARRAREAIAAYKDYEAIFTKSELVGRRMFKGQMRIKFRPRPFSVYLRFIDQNNGREVMYVEGQYQNKLVAHEPPGTLRGMVTVQLDPRGQQAMAEGRHPITEIGMQKMMDALIELWESETRFGECECQYYPNAKSGDVDCRVLEVTHPQPRRQFRFHRTLLFIDKKTEFPVRLQQWGFPPAPQAEPYLIEEYIYTDIRTNVGLTNADFDIRNRNYRF